MSNNIPKRENEQTSIEKLAAQCEIYSIAKTFFYMQTSLSVPLMIFLSFLKLFLPELDLTLVIATTSIFVVLIDNLLNDHIIRLKEEASKIQEYFDIYVLNLEWNNILCGEKPEHNNIYKYFKKYERRKNMAEFYNWYDTKIQNVSELTGKIICQKSNCVYDSLIRNKYNTVVVSVGLLAILFIIMFSIFSRVHISSIILFIIFPCVPVIKWTLNNINTNNASIKNLERLNFLINSTWERLKSNCVIENCTIRQIQDGIFINRRGNPLIPDFVYNLLRDNLEKQMHYSVSELLKEIDRSQK